MGDAATYPNVLRSYLATLLDLLTLWFCVYGITRVPLASDADWGILVAVIAVALLYEPIFSSQLCTIGQALMGIRVRESGSLDRIAIHRAYLRLFVKYALGAISVLTIPAREDRTAIHDLAVNSIVVDARFLTHRAA